MAGHLISTRPGLKKWLGNGSTATVYLNYSTDPPLVYKHIHKGTQVAISKDLFDKECKALESLRNPNIIQYFRCRIDEDAYVICMEYAERGHLRSVLTDPTIVFNMKTVLCWAEHLMNALSFLETQKLLHRDIKPENVLVKTNFDLKLSDFGFVKDLSASSGSSFSYRGTQLYISPELHGEHGKVQIDSRSDLYSTCLVIWEIIERRPFYKDYKKSGELFFDFRNNPLFLEAPNCQHPIGTTIMRAIKYMADERPSVAEMYAIINGMNQGYTDHEKTPEIVAGQEDRLRPIGFDGTNERVPVEEFNCDFGNIPTGLSTSSESDEQLSDDGARDAQVTGSQASETPSTTVTNDQLTDETNRLRSNFKRKELEIFYYPFAGETEEVQEVFQLFTSRMAGLSFEKKIIVIDACSTISGYMTDCEFSLDESPVVRLERYLAQTQAETGLSKEDLAIIFDGFMPARSILAIYYFTFHDLLSALRIRELENSPPDKPQDRLRNAAQKLLSLKENPQNKVRFFLESYTMKNSLDDTYYLLSKKEKLFLRRRSGKIERIGGEFSHDDNEFSPTDPGKGTLLKGPNVNIDIGKLGGSVNLYVKEIGHDPTQEQVNQLVLKLI